MDNIGDLTDLAKTIFDNRIKEIENDAPKKTMEYVQGKWRGSSKIGNTGIDINTLRDPSQGEYELRHRGYFRYKRTKEEFKKRKHRSKKRLIAYDLIESSEVDVLTIARKRTEEEKKASKYGARGEKEVFVILAYERLPAEYKGEYKIDSSGNETKGRTSSLDRLLAKSIRQWAEAKKLGVEIEIKNDGDLAK